MSGFIAEHNREGSWETEDVTPQWIKQSNFYTQKVLEGWTIKRENLVNYHKILSNINYLKASGTSFPFATSTVYHFHIQEEQT